MKPDFLKETKKGLLINESDIETLKKYDIDVDNYSTLTEVIFKIDEVIENSDLDDEELDELDYIAMTMQERNYYKNFNK